MKLQDLLESYNLENSDLPLIHKEIQIKATEIINQRRTNKTPVYTLRRMLEGFYVQLKTVSIKISKEAGYFKLITSSGIFNLSDTLTFTLIENSKARNKFRRILTETKRKALKTIDLLNSKDKDLPISYEDFNRGVFPWEAVINEKDTQFPTRNLKISIINSFKLFNVSILQFLMPINTMLLTVGCFCKEQKRKLYLLRTK